MIPLSRQGGRGRWVALIAALALLGGIAVAATQWSRPARLRAPAPNEGAVTPADTDGTAVPAPDKQAWLDVVKGADLSTLTARQRERLVRFANAQQCTCGCGYTVASCRSYDPTCPVSGPKVEALLDSVRRNLATDTRGLRDRPPPIVLPRGHPTLP